MAQKTVTLSDGRIMTLDVPEGTTSADIEAFIQDELEKERTVKGLSMAPTFEPRPEAPRTELPFDIKDFLKSVGTAGLGYAGGGPLGALATIPGLLKGQEEATAGGAAGQLLGNLIPGAGKLRGLTQGLLTVGGSKLGEKLGTGTTTTPSGGDVIGTLLPMFTGGTQARLAKAAETAPGRVAPLAEKEVRQLGPKVPAMEAAPEFQTPYFRQVGSSKDAILRAQAELAALRGELKTLPKPQDNPAFDVVRPSLNKPIEDAYNKKVKDLNEKLASKRVEIANLRRAPQMPDPEKVLEKFRSGKEIAEIEINDLVRNLSPEDLSQFRSRAASSVLAQINPKQAFTLGKDGGELKSITDNVTKLGAEKINNLFGNKEAYQKLLRLGNLVDRRTEEAFTSRSPIGEAIRFHPISAIGIIFSARQEGGKRLLPWNKVVDYILAPSNTVMGKKMSEYLLDTLENPGKGTVGTSLGRAFEDFLRENSRPLERP